MGSRAGRTPDAHLIPVSNLSVTVTKPSSGTVTAFFCCHGAEQVNHYVDGACCNAKLRIIGEANTGEIKFILVITAGRVATGRYEMVSAKFADCVGRRNKPF